MLIRNMRVHGGCVDEVMMSERRGVRLRDRPPQRKKQEARQPRMQREPKRHIRRAHVAHASMARTAWLLHPLFAVQESNVAVRDDGAA